MNIKNLLITAFASVVASIATLLAVTSTFGSVFWIFEEPETPSILKD